MMRKWGEDPAARSTDGTGGETPVTRLHARASGPETGAHVQGEKRKPGPAVRHYCTKLKFKGREYILVGESGQINTGAISTKHQFENGLQSYAHLFPDGAIKRLGVQIGSREDIEWLGETQVNPKSSALFNIFFDPSWTRWLLK